MAPKKGLAASLTLSSHLRRLKKPQMQATPPGEKSRKGRVTEKALCVLPERSGAQ